VNRYQLMRSLTKENKNLTVPWYIMAAYAYYVQDNPLLTDYAFDNLAKTMIKHWPEITHRHKYFITLDELRAGTLLRRDFPSIIPGAVEKVRQIKQ